MFTTIKNWLTGRTPTDLFAFQVSGKTRYADPARVKMKLDESGQWLELVRKVASLAAPASPAIVAAMGGAEERRKQLESASRDLADLSRKAFNLQTVDPETGEGATDARAITILSEYLEFMAVLAEDALPLA